MNALRQNAYVRPKANANVTIRGCGALSGWGHRTAGRIASLGERDIEIDLPHFACPPGWRGYGANKGEIVRVRIDWRDAGKLEHIP